MRIVVFANGIMTDPVAEVGQWVEPDSLLVAADGGAVHALAAGLDPDHVIGDMDSLSVDRQTSLESRGAEMHRASVDKDETDLELALTWAAKQPGSDEILVLGAFGGRPDQALANLLLLALPVLQGRQVLMVDGAWTVRVIRGGERVCLEGNVGDRLSLIPLAGPAAGVTTGGLRFTLRDETLDFGPARGVSNRLEATTATVVLREGLLWCFHERRLGETRDS